ncbi:DUF4395 domain-containing protein [Nocardioides bizhenqiangii]|uniref:DUF4395 domain-containing protein n=1 Tax=Nocardioides bizhenqiangii TaxID=3095076 RepID=A0ABZ0ZNT1_9ACTN|nr:MULTISPECIES: DUF4395 domain-containing protein [unclassified Nocardioides]MDZ5620023.1 DUF4395 domain-containing protein [Nocardioides sp. HM23]WQQ25975.1 DUF4395 domain-containing protein [Nocardioides sp. HM61]
MTQTTKTAPFIGIDPRGPRFTASVTAVLLAVALVVPDPVAATLIAVQAVLFALGVALGVQRTPTGLVFRSLIRPRLTPPAELEDPGPPRFAQGVGLAFAAVALIGYLTGAVLVAQIAVGLALAAALLNAVFAFCLGCELYLLGARVRRA